MSKSANYSIQGLVNDVEERIEDFWVWIKWFDSIRSSSVSYAVNENPDDDTALKDAQGTQPYLFEPRHSETSSGTDSSNESEEAD